MSIGTIGAIIVGASGTLGVEQNATRTEGEDPGVSIEDRRRLERDTLGILERLGLNIGFIPVMGMVESSLKTGSEPTVDGVLRSATERMRSGKRETKEPYLSHDDVRIIESHLAHAAVSEGTAETPIGDTSFGLERNAARFGTGAPAAAGGGSAADRLSRSARRELEQQVARILEREADAHWPAQTISVPVETALDFGAEPTADSVLQVIVNKHREGQWPADKGAFPPQVIEKIADYLARNATEGARRVLEAGLNRLLIEKGFESYDRVASWVVTHVLERLSDHPLMAEALRPLTAEALQAAVRRRCVYPSERKKDILNELSQLARAFNEATGRKVSDTVTPGKTNPTAPTSATSGSTTTNGAESAALSRFSRIREATERVKNVLPAKLVQTWSLSFSPTHSNRSERPIAEGMSRDFANRLISLMRDRIQITEGGVAVDTKGIAEEFYRRIPSRSLPGLSGDVVFSKLKDPERDRLGRLVNAAAEVIKECLTNPDLGKAPSGGNGGPSGNAAPSSAPSGSPAPSVPTPSSASSAKQFRSDLSSLRGYTATSPATTYIRTTNWEGYGAGGKRAKAGLYNRRLFVLGGQAFYGVPVIPLAQDVGSHWGALLPARAATSAKIRRSSAIK